VKKASTVRSFLGALGVLGGSILSLALLSGCGSKGANLTFSSADGERVFRSNFSQAYIARTSNIDYEVLLISDTSVAAKKEKPGVVLQTATLAPVRQFVDLRVFWQPQHGVHADHPAATNAAMDWYVFGDPNAPGGDMLHYVGTAFVFVYPNGNAATVVLKNATVKLKERRGNMNDVLGTSTANGTFKARRDTQRLNDLVAEMKGAADGKTPQMVAMPPGPPVRTPLGP
jgi:hypothetical protein